MLFGDALHLVLEMTGLGLTRGQAIVGWEEVRQCLSMRGHLGPLRWHYEMPRGCTGFCRLDAFLPPGGPPLVLLTEEPSNPGVPLREALGLVIVELVACLDLNLRQLRVVVSEGGQFAVVTFGAYRQGIDAPQRRPLELRSREEVAASAAALPPAAHNLSVWAQA